MKMKYLVLGVLLICTLVRANNFEQFVATITEQEKASMWVKKSTNSNISDFDAIKIVRETYSHSYSKNIDPILVLAIIRNESNFVIKAKSKSGSVGLMQVIPYWHKDKLAGRDPLGITTSIDVGTQILRDCLTKSKGVMLKALSCYSGGGGKTYYDKVMKYQYALAQSLKQQDVLISKN